MVERELEQFLFKSRWLLAPLYVALVFGLLGLVLKTMQELFHFLLTILSASEADVVLGVPTLVHLTLTGSLIVVVVFAGYENFVSRIDLEGHEDCGMSSSISYLLSLECSWPCPTGSGTIIVEIALDPCQASLIFAKQ
jgi:uncharacterized protein (TIGR00645 family)